MIILRICTGIAGGGDGETNSRKKLGCNGSDQVTDDEDSNERQG